MYIGTSGNEGLEITEKGVTDLSAKHLRAG